MVTPIERQLLSRPLWAAALILLLALLAAVAAVETTRHALAKERRAWLQNEAQRRAIELMGQTLNGKIMGSMNVLGLVIPSVKAVARGEAPEAVAAVNPMLAAIGNSYGADGVFIAGTQGVITASWDHQGRNNMGLDIKFRSYFQMAMQGKENVYAAVSVSTGERVLYFAAPVLAETGKAAPPIGAAVARINIAQLNAGLAAWPAPAVLLTPQGVVFAANRADWVNRLQGEVTTDRVKQIQALKQFGKVFDDKAPLRLPLDIDSETVHENGVQLAVVHVPVQWNDPLGDWTLVLTTDLGRVMPLSQELAVGAAAGGAALILLLLGYGLLRSRRQREDTLRALQESAEEARGQAQLRQGLAALSLRLQQKKQLPELAQAFLTEAVDLLEMRQGAVYLADASGLWLERLATYACRDDAACPEALAFGEGLLGQCAQNRKRLVLDDPAASDWRISSGLGDTLPRAVVLAPVLLNETVVAVVELALMSPLEGDRQVLFDELLPLLAMNIEIRRGRQHKPEDSPA